MEKVIISFYEEFEQLVGCTWWILHYPFVILHTDDIRVVFCPIIIDLTPHDIFKVAIKTINEMTHKNRKTMIEQWVKEVNPKTILRAADARCGARYTVYVVNNPGEFGTRCTEYLPLNLLEQYLLGVLYAKEFIQRMGRTA